MTLLAIEKFGGICPKIIDPALLAPDKAQFAINCRFDMGGVTPLRKDLYIESYTGGNNGPLSMFTYWNSNNRYFFAWETDVDAVKTPIPNDSYNRVYYTEGGILKVTDGNLFNANNATLYPSQYRLPCPPAPVNPIFALVKAPDPTSGSFLTDGNNNSTASDSNATHGANLACDVDANNAPILTTWWQSNNAILHLSGNGGGPTIINANNGANAVWWKYDFGANVANAVNHLEITYNNTTSNNAFVCGPGGFKVQGSNDGNNWTDLYEAGNITEAMWAANDTMSWNWTPPLDGNGNQKPNRYIRLYFTQTSRNNYSNNHKMALMDVQMTNIPGQPDPTLKETRAYTYTFVNEYGEEGPPALVPQDNYIDCYDGDTIYLNGMDGNLATGNNGAPNPNIGSYITNLAGNNLVTLGNLFNIKKINIYRTNQGAAGSSQFQLVDQVNYPDNNSPQYTDTVKDSALGLVLPSADWDIAPDGIQGLIALPNGVIAGFVDNLVCLSAPYFPHAWPASQQYPCDRDIIGIGAFGTTVVALTSGNPFAIVGNDPSNVVMEKLDSAFSCVSKRGIVHIGNVVIYPSPEGLVGIGSGGVELLTKDILDRNSWNTLYNPSTISAYYWEGKYVAFYTTTDGFEKGFMFDLKTRDLTTLTFYAAAGTYDPTDGSLYLFSKLSDDTVEWDNYAGNAVTWNNAGNNTVTWISGSSLIVSFAQGNDYRQGQWQSKRYRFKPTSFGALKVIGNSYPIALGYHGEIKGVPVYYYPTINSNDFVRTPVNFIDMIEVSLVFSDEVSGIYLASLVEELPL